LKFTDLQAERLRCFKVKATSYLPKKCYAVMMMCLHKYQIVLSRAVLAGLGLIGFARSKLTGQPHPMIGLFFDRFFQSFYNAMMTMIWLLATAGEPAKLRSERERWVSYSAQSRSRNVPPRRLNHRLSSPREKHLESR